MSIEFRVEHAVIKIVRGDITRSVTDAVVCPANAFLTMRGGVAGALRTRGGEAIEREAMARAPVRVGAAIATTGGSLPFQVIHAPTIESPVDRADPEGVRAATRAACRCADEIGVATLAIPGMGTGTGILPYDEGARAMVEEIALHLRSGAGSIREIHLVGRSEELFDAFVAACRRSIAPAASESAGPRPRPG